MTPPGRAWRVRAAIDTDQLAPGRYMRLEPQQIARHCLEDARPDFAAQVRPGDALVAGPHFGIGSSREQAATGLKLLGVGAVIAPSFGGLFFRNACNIGLLLLECPRAEEIAEGERIGWDARAATVQRADGGLLPCTPLPTFLLDMVEAGGLIEQLRRRRAQTFPT